MNGASALQTATVDGGTPVSDRRARTPSRRGGRAGEAAPCLLLQKVVTPFRPPPVLFSQWRQSRRPPQWLLAAWPRKYKYKYKYKIYL